MQLIETCDVGLFFCHCTLYDVKGLQNVQHTSHSRITLNYHIFVHSSTTCHVSFICWISVDGVLQFLLRCWNICFMFSSIFGVEYRIKPMHEFVPPILLLSRVCETCSVFDAMLVASFESCFAVRLISNFHLSLKIWILNQVLYHLVTIS